MIIPALTQSYELLNDRFQLFSFWQSSLYLFMFNQRTSHISKHSLSMFMGPVQAAVTTCMAHFVSPFTFFFVWRFMRVNPSLLGHYCPALIKMAAHPIIKSYLQAFWLSLQYYQVASLLHPYLNASPFQTELL